MPRILVILFISLEHKPEMKTAEIGDHDSIVRPASLSSSGDLLTRYLVAVTISKGSKMVLFYLGISIPVTRTFDSGDEK
jgi:hypothetical protein